MAGRFLEIAATDAVSAFVAAKLAGQTDKEAGNAASGQLSDELRAALDPSNQLQKWKPLAQPLADLLADGGGTELSLAAPAASHAAQVGQWDWTFKAEAPTRLVADVLDADQLAQLQIPPRDGHAVVRYAVGGALSAAAQGGGDVDVDQRRVIHRRIEPQAPRRSPRRRRALSAAAHEPGRSAGTRR